MIAPRFDDELIKKLLDIDDNLTITMHMQTMDPVEAIKMIKRALSDIQKMKIEEQKKAVRSGYDMDILPTDIVTYEKNTLELLDDLNTSNQKLIKMTFLITCYGRTKRELENLIQRVSGIVQQANCNLRCLQYLQEQGLMASAPIGCNDTGIERNLTTKSTAVLVPFCTQELFMPAPAIYYGLNALSNNMIMADRKRLRTPNGVILGTPGSGKSFSAKREILSCFLMTKDDIIVCDPEGEYFPLVQALHGQVVRLATNSKDYLNPMDIQLSHKVDKEALKLKSDFLITLCDLIAGGKGGLENDEKGIIDTCIKHIYDTYFEKPTPENMPILEDLYNALLKYEPKDVAPGVMEEMGLPFAYDHFVEGEAPKPPFLVFLYPKAVNFAADGIAYFKVNHLDIELYTDLKQPEVEERIEAVLLKHGIFYGKSEVWIESERLYEVLYEMEV